MEYYLFEDYEEALKNVIIDTMLWLRKSRNNFLDDQLNLENLESIIPSVDKYIESVIGLDLYNEIIPIFEEYEKGNMSDKEMLGYYEQYTKDKIVGKWSSIRQIDNPEHQYFNYYVYVIFQPPRAGLTIIQDDGTLFLIEEDGDI